MTSPPPHARRAPPATARAKSSNQATRLAGEQSFRAIFRHGSRCEGRYVEIVIVPAALTVGRVGFVLGRKTLRRAVDRNRLKRVLREFLRTSRDDVRRFDLVIRLKRALPRDALGEAADEAIALIRRGIAG